MRLLVAGCGSIGRRHLHNLKSLEVGEVAAFDVDLEKTVSIARELEVSTFSDLDVALGQRWDAVLVCTPTHLHLDVAQKALCAGAHLFIEKPISHAPEGVEELILEAETRKAVVLVGCNLRFHPPVRQIQRWLDEEAIGQLQFLRLRYGNYLPNWRPGDYRDNYSAQQQQGGGIILDAIHELDLAQLWLGQACSVYCLADKLSDLDIDVEDTAEILLRTDRALVEIHLDYLRPERARTYELIGSEGMIRWAACGKGPERSTLGLFDSDNDGWETFELESDLNEMYVEEMKHFLACIRGEESPAVDAARGRDLLALALAAKTSAKTRREVSLANGWVSSELSQ